MMGRQYNDSVLAAMHDALKIEKDDSVPSYDSIDELKKALLTEDIEERLKYINRQMAIMDYNTDMRVSREEGHKAGLEDGHKAGLEEGHKAGLADGEKIADRRTALNMLKTKEPIEKITQYTNLTEAEIHELAKEI